MKSIFRDTARWPGSVARLVGLGQPALVAGRLMTDFGYEK